MSKEKHWRDIVKYSGAMVAFLIGSGFASGQEVMQFFTSYGTIRSGLAGFISLTTFIWFTSTVMVDARALKLESTNSIFSYYCGNIIGAFFEWLTPVFLFGIFVVMLSGAGAITKEYFGISETFGRLIMAILSLTTVLLGLDKLVNVVSKIGPLIIILVIGIGFASIITGSSIAEADTIMQTITIMKAAPNWWLSGITYASFCAVTILPFLAGMARNARSDVDCRAAGLYGSLAFILAAMVLNYGMLSHIVEVYDKDVPSVFMADKLWYGAGILFVAAMFAGIYTTAVPMLWSSCNKISSDDRSVLFRTSAIILTCVAYFGGSLPFSTLVNIIYPYMGYLGFLVLGGILLKQIKSKSI